MKIAILGFGREGRAVLDFLKKFPKYDFAEIWVLDKSAKVEIPKGLKVRKKTGERYLKNLDKFDLIFRSPGVPFNLSEIQNALKKGTIISSATKLFFENCSSRIIGVTGTKGKGTTCTLIYHILKNSGTDVFLAGNIGQPALDILPMLKQHSIVILELSSFQLQDLSISPQVAVVLDIFPDHLDAHKNFKEYLEAKVNITRYQTRADKNFFFRGSKLAMQIAKKGLGRKMSVAAGKWLSFKKEELKIPGEHNFKNAIMAAAVTQSLGVSKEIIRETVISFTGNEHRLEFVRSIIIASPDILLMTKQSHKTATGTIAIGPRSDILVNFYNDSASTNPQTTLAAIKSFDQPIILIAGGYDKGLDYSPLAKEIRKTQTKLVVLFGANKNKIKKSLKRFPTILCEDLKSVVKTAVQHAVVIARSEATKQSQNFHNQIILFSPGAASFDMFKDYTDRGRRFKEIVMNL